MENIMETKKIIVKLTLAIFCAAQASDLVAMNNNHAQNFVITNNVSNSKTVTCELKDDTTTSDLNNNSNSWGPLSTAFMMVTTPRETLVKYLKTILPENSNTNWIAGMACMYLLAEAIYGKFGSKSYYIVDPTVITGTGWSSLAKIKHIDKGVSQARIWCAILSGIFLTGKLGYWWWNPDARYKILEQAVSELKKQMERGFSQTNTQLTRTNLLITQTGAQVHHAIQEGNQGLQQQISLAHSEAEKGRQHINLLLGNIEQNAQIAYQGFGQQINQIDNNTQSLLWLQTFNTLALMYRDKIDPKILQNAAEQIIAKVKNPIIISTLRAITNQSSIQNFITMKQETQQGENNK